MTSMTYQKWDVTWHKFFRISRNFSEFFRFSSYKDFWTLDIMWQYCDNVVTMVWQYITWPKSLCYNFVTILLQYKYNENDSINVTTLNGTFFCTKTNFDSSGDTVSPITWWRHMLCHVSPILYELLTPL